MKSSVMTQKKIKPNISIPRGLVEYLLRVIGVSAACISSETQFEVDGHLVTATQVVWRQCVGHIFPSETLGKDPRSGDPLFLDHRVILFDTRLRTPAKDEYLTDYRVYFCNAKNEKSDNDLVAIYHQRNGNFVGMTWFSLVYVWPRNTFSSHFFPKPLGDKIKKEISDLRYSSSDSSSRRLKNPKWKFSTHPRVLARNRRAEIMRQIFEKTEVLLKTEREISALQEEIRNISKTSWNK